MVRKLCFLLCIVFVLAALWTIFQQQSQVSAEPKNELNEELKKRVEANTINAVEDQNAETGNSYDYLFPVIDGKLDNDLGAESGDYDLLLKETSSQVFSSDAYIEGFSIHLRAAECHFLDARFMKYQLNESKTGARLLHKKQKQCQQWKSQFPMLSAKQMWMNEMAKLPATTEVGQLIKYYLQVADSTEKTALAYEIFELGLKEQNPYIFDYILNLEVVSDSYLTEEYKQNTTYSELIFSAAIDLLSCEYNQAEFCSASSWLMINKCSSNTTYCGLTYQQWFEQNFMPGMKQDVIVVLGQLKKISNGADIE